MKTSKDIIFQSLRRSAGRQFPCPDLSSLEAEALVFDDPLETFCQSVKAGGGQIVRGTMTPGRSDASPDNPCEDSFTVSGEFGVAENGAIWIREIPDGASRVDLFIHESLVVRLREEDMVCNMHQAYLRLGEKSDGYGIFISGPSKTADIEQALVFGAHGPKELIVNLIH